MDEAVCLRALAVARSDYRCFEKSDLWKRNDDRLETALRSKKKPHLQAVSLYIHDVRKEKNSLTWSTLGREFISG